MKSIAINIFGMMSSRSCSLCNDNPQPHENHTHRFPTLATAHPQGVRQLQPPRQIRNDQALVRQLDPARSYPPSQKRLTMEWIRPQDQMPKEGEVVLVCNEIGLKSVASYDTYYNEWNCDCSWWPREVAYWMPIPQPPKP